MSLPLFMGRQRHLVSKSIHEIRVIIFKMETITSISKEIADSTTTTSHDTEKAGLHEDNTTFASANTDHAGTFVEFDGPKDPQNPLNWSRGYKLMIVCLLSAMNLIV